MRPSDSFKLADRPAFTAVAAAAGMPLNPAVAEPAGALLLAQASTNWPCSSGSGMPDASSRDRESGREAFLGRMPCPMGSPWSSPTMLTLLSTPARNNTTLQGRQPAEHAGVADQTGRGCR